MGQALAQTVECHSGSTYAERPTALVWQGQRLEIETIEQRWITPNGRAFRVQTACARRFELLYDELKDSWSVTEI